MRTQVIVGTVALAVGCTAGYFVGAAGRPAPTGQTEPAPRTENEAVLEFRVRVPAASKAPASRAGCALVNTGTPLDLAVEGDGYFQITTPSGDARYTRDGAFRLNNVGNLVTADGFLVNPQITIPPTAVNVQIGADGTVSVVHAGAANVSTQLGQLTLARFANEGGLVADGQGLFAETQSSGCPNIATPGLNGTGLVRQGFRERRAEHLASALAALVQQIADEDRRNGAVSGVVTRSR